MDDLTSEQFAAAKARGEAGLRGPRAESAQYDAARDRVIVRLSSGVEIGFAPGDAEGLEHASTEDLTHIEVQAFGLGIHFPRLDVDLYVPALLQGLLGSERWIAAKFGAGSAIRNASAPADAQQDAEARRMERLAPATRHPLEVLAGTASVSYGERLDRETLDRILRDGHFDPRWAGHVMTMIEETPLAILARAVSSYPVDEQVGVIEGLRALARVIGSDRIERWMTG